MKRLSTPHLALCAVLFLCAALPAAAQRQEIIDMHCHAAGAGYGGSGCFVSQELQDSIKFRIYLRSFGVTLEELREQGDALVIRKIAQQVRASSHVHKAVVLALDGVIAEDGSLDRQATELYLPNEFVRDEVINYDNLLYGASINPWRADAIMRLRQAASDGAVLVKWLPSIMMIDPADERLIPFYREMARLGMPLLSHTGNEASFTRARNELADPARLELALRHGVTVIAAHMASSGRNEGRDNMDRLSALMHRYPNLYADISSLTQLNRYGALARALQDSRLHGRLLYGTDYPLISTLLCMPLLHVLEIGPRDALRIQRIGNAWDRDVELKRALGLPDPVFTRFADLLLQQ